MALYKVNSGDIPQASDVNQFTDAVLGNHDIGQIKMADRVTYPATGPSGSLASGTALGVGTYKYQVTFITGYKKSNGTLVVTGETGPSPFFQITTTSGNQKVNLSSIPTSASTTVIGRRIYRTKVNASTYYLLAEIADNVTTTYTDTTPDASLPTTQVPTSNTTGTYFPTVYVGSDQRGRFKATGNTMVHVENTGGSLYLEGQLHAYIAANAWYDGTNWYRYVDNDMASAIVVYKNAEPEFRSIGTGTGAITWNTYNIFHEGNFSKRTHVEAYLGGSNQSLTQNTWTRVMFNTKNVDYLNEYSTSTGLFTAQKDGIYAISFSVKFINVPSGGAIIIGINSPNRTLTQYSYEDSTTLGTVIYSGSHIVYLSAGAQIEVQMWTNQTGVQAETGGSDTWLNISRIA